jgi:hypothetical protein
MTERQLLDEILAALKASTERDNIHDPIYEPLVDRVCAGNGYGALMDSAQRCWRRDLKEMGLAGGEHIAGPARATVDRWLKLHGEMVQKRRKRRPAYPIRPCVECGIGTQKTGLTGQTLEPRCEEHGGRMYY